MGKTRRAKGIKRKGGPKDEASSKARETPIPPGKVKVLEDGRLRIMQAVKGLSRDGDLARRLVEAERPDLVALGIAPEELDGLKSLMKDDSGYEPDLSNIDMAYAKHLGEYGEVVAPPPCFTQAIMAADALDIPVVALDLDIEVHTDIYVKNVEFSDLLRQSMRFRSIKKKKFKIATPEEFALTWDMILNKAEGFSIVEGAREACMTDSIKCLLEEARLKKVLAVIEIERVAGIIDRLLETRRKEIEEGKRSKKAKGTKGGKVKKG
jgi:pheromone shutdown protein TraB